MLHKYFSDRLKQAINFNFKLISLNCLYRYSRTINNTTLFS